MAPFVLVGVGEAAFGSGVVTADGDADGDGEGEGKGMSAGLGVKVLLGTLPIISSLRQNAFMFRISAYSFTGSLLIRIMVLRSRGFVPFARV